jgi:hypothetical protein
MNKPVPPHQPRHDLARLVAHIKALVRTEGAGLSVTEAICAIELAKLELLMEDAQNDL